MVEPINPFASQRMTTEQRIVRKAEQQANLKQNKMEANLQNKDWKHFTRLMKKLEIISEQQKH
jgi:replicative DNA helicase